MALVVFSLAFGYSGQAATPTSQAAATKTLEGAILLAGPSVAGLPIVLTAVPPAAASRGVEAWTLLTEAGNGERIVVYSESDAFHCASNPHRPDYQCLLKLASAIVHEAWHYRHGLNETDAYDAQIAYLALHGGSSAQIGGVRLARNRVHSAQQAIERRRN
jgi:hypothetical protein